MNLMIVFLAGFASVFMQGFQSRAVNHGNFKMAACNSFLIATLTTTLWGALFKDLSWAATLTYASAGACGITSSMWVHHRFFVRGKK